MSELVLEYYLLLRSVFKNRPHLRKCLSRCRHCRIFFVTDPRNAGRKDLRCGFGCQREHRKRQSVKRSVAYYRDQAGKIKKAIQNARRPKTASAKAVVESEPVGSSVVLHIQRVVSLIEGRAVRRQEILELLARVLRQHSMVRRRRINQAVEWLNANPP